jgi:hypothetical protein
MLTLDKSSVRWGLKAFSMLRIMGRDKFKGKHAIELVSLLLTRFPLLTKVLHLLDCTFGTTIDPQVCAALISCIRLRAILDFIEWKMFYHKFYNYLGPSHATAFLLTNYWLLYVIEDLLLWLNNYAHSDLTGHLEEIRRLLPLHLNSDTLSSDHMKQIAVWIGQRWDWAMVFLMRETAEGGWLSRYLVFEIGRAYRKFSLADLLFAVYKL